MQQQVFNKLSVRFLSAHILTQFNSTYKTILVTDAGHQAIAGVQSQYNVINRCKQLYSVEYYSKIVSAM